MVNAGAIIVCSLLMELIEKEMSLAEKFDYVNAYFKVSLDISQIVLLYFLIFSFPFRFLSIPFLFQFYFFMVLV